MNVSTKQLAAELLKVSGITTVISVDDWYAKDFDIEEVLAAVNIVDENALQTIVSAEPLSIAYVDRDITKAQLKDRWASLEKTIQREIWSSLISAQGQTDQTAHGLLNDLRIGSVLPELFGDFNLQMLSLTKWRQERDAIISANMPCTLLLIDENFGDEAPDPHEGLNIIDNLLKAQPEQQIVCALLSNNYNMRNIHSDWKSLSNEKGFSRSRFVLIPKDSLSSDHHKFLALIKLAVFNGRAEKMKQAVNTLYSTALDVAKAKVEGIDIYEFEQIVCASSSKEGVWEPETLIRVHSLFHKQEARGKARLDTALHNLSNELRAVSELALTDWGSPTPSAIEIHQLEWYENATEVNEQLMPTELGDIFQIDGRDTKRYILVAQPCDLMVRPSGKRNGYTEYVMILEITPSTGKHLSSSGTFSLEFYEDSTDWHVNLKAAHYIDLNILDLCALNEEGCAQLSLDTASLDRLTPAWRRRDIILRKNVKAIIDKYQTLVQAKVSESEAQKISTTVWLGKLFSGNIDAANNSLAYNFHRVGRLRQPRAGALLSKYAASVAREAFEHPFAIRGGNETVESNLAPSTEVENHGQDAVAKDADPVSPATTADAE